MRFLNHVLISFIWEKLLSTEAVPTGMERQIFDRMFNSEHCLSLLANSCSCILILVFHSVRISWKIRAGVQTSSPWTVSPVIGSIEVKKLLNCIISISRYIGWVKTWYLLWIKYAKTRNYILWCKTTWNVFFQITDKRSCYSFLERTDIIHGDCDANGCFHPWTPAPNLRQVRQHHLVNEVLNQRDQK